MKRIALVLAIPLTAATQVARAQMDHAAPPHGAPSGRLGRVTFPTSCGAAAQQHIQRGLALLHSFWYEEAVRTFREAAAADSSCAMAQWGIASAYLHPLWAPPTAAEVAAGTAAVARARALPAPTPRETQYIAAIGAYWDDHGSAPHGLRLQRWSDALGALAGAHPDDGEAAAFHALSLVVLAQNSRRQVAIDLSTRAIEILEPLFQRQPNHPGLAHYLIHAFDMPGMAAGGARAANRYAGIAPSVPHAQHMPSHIYILLGQWDSAVASNVRSAASAARYERETRMDAVWDQRLHAMDYVTYSYLQMGRDRVARRLVDTTATMRRVFPENSIAATYPLAAIPARYALERGQWADAARLEPRDGLPPAAAAVTQFARAIGAARSGDTAAARSAVVALRGLDSTLAASPVAKLPGMVHAQRLTAESWLSFASGDTAAALARAAEAADFEDVTDKHPVTPGAILPARELLGDMLSETGRHAAARAAYDSSLAMQPRRARSLMGAARAAQAAGDSRAAQRYLRDLRALLARADPERRQLVFAAR
jgi:Tfp pilus assembly protein PilF